MIEDNPKMAQEFPAEYVKNLLDAKDANGNTIFGAATYSGYKVELVDEKEKEENPDAKDKAKFSVKVKMNSRQSAYNPDAETEDTTEDKK